MQYTCRCYHAAEHSCIGYGDDDENTNDDHDEHDNNDDNDIDDNNDYGGRR